MTDIKVLLSENSVSVANRLTRYMDKYDCNADWKQCAEAMRYSLISTGKAIRPFLAVSFSKMLGGDEKLALDFGCGVEMMHASSLIHDDLPAMDNDDFRRGKPSCHKKFGEYTAILAGDALLLTSLDIMTENAPAVMAAKAVHILASLGGPMGMIGGQQLDLEYESRDTITEKMLADMCMHKTAALIKASCLLGVLTAESRLSVGEYAAAKKAAEDYAENLGLAFQIYDDVLDVTGDEKSLGKPVGSDAAKGKVTYASLLGTEKAKERYKYYTDKAIKAISVYPNSDTLKDLAEMLIRRAN